MGERTSPLVWVVTGLVMAFLAAPSLLVIAMSFSGPATSALTSSAILWASRRGSVGWT